MHVGRRSSHPSTNRSHCEGKKNCVDIQGPRLYNVACEGLLLTEVRTAPRTAMPAVPSPALPQTTCRVQLQSVASRVPKLIPASAHPEHLRLWNAAKPRSVRSGAERNEAEDLPSRGKPVQHPLTSQVKGCGHAPALLCFVAERHALEGAARRTRSPAWRGRETHGCEIEHRRL